MKALCALVLVVSVGTCDLAAQGGELVRPMDPQAVQACDYGREASASFRALLAAFEAGHVVVHVVSGEVRVFGTAGTTRLVGAAGDWRYLRITVDPDLPLDQRTAVLAHELQHAREIATAAAVTQREVRRLYERIGQPVNGSPDTFETREAMSAGTRVWRELRTPVARTRASELTHPAPDAQEPRVAALRVQ